MKISKIPGLGSYGHFIDDLDFNTITDEEWMKLGRFHTKDLVTIIRNCNMPYNKYEEYIEKWGKSTLVAKYNLLKKYKKSNLMDISSMFDQLDPLEKEYLAAAQKTMGVEISNKKIPTSTRVSGKRDKQGDALGVFAEGELLWHSNESAHLCHGSGVALYGRTGMVGSSTGFLTTVDWYESQSESFRSELDEMIIVHEWTPGKINPGLSAQQDTLIRYNMAPLDQESELPLIMRNQAGIKGLHFSVNTCKSVKGMSQEDSKKFFDYLESELFVDKYMYDHWYKQNNDLLLFDNTITLHRRLGSVESRLAYRISYDMCNIASHRFDRYLLEPFNTEYKEQLKDIDSIYVDLLEFQK